MLSAENRLSSGPPAATEGVALAPPNSVGAKVLLPPAVPGAAALKQDTNSPPVFAVEEKLNPEAEPNPEGAAGLSAFGAANEKVEAESVEEDPSPDGGWVGAAKALPKPAGDDDDDGTAEEPNPEAVKLKLLAWAGAGTPKSAW